MHRNFVTFKSRIWPIVEKKIVGFASKASVTENSKFIVCSI